MLYRYVCTYSYYPKEKNTVKLRFIYVHTYFTVEACEQVCEKSDFYGDPNRRKKTMLWSSLQTDRRQAVGYFSVTTFFAFQNSMNNAKISSMGSKYKTYHTVGNKSANHRMEKKREWNTMDKKTTDDVVWFNANTYGAYMYLLIEFFCNKCLTIRNFPGWVFYSWGDGVPGQASLISWLVHNVIFFMFPSVSN